MSTVHMSIGIPGAGKTTYWKKFVQRTGAVYVCPDDIRAEILGDYRDQTQNPKIWQMAFDQIEAAIKSGQDVVVDGAGIERSYRKSDIKHYRQWGPDKVIGYWFNTPLDVCRARNAARKQPIPDEVLPKLHERLQHESPQFADGFDEINVIEND